MKEQGKRVRQPSQEDAAFNKMLIWMAGCVALEGLTLLLRRVYLNFSNTDFGVALAMGLSRFFGVFRFAGIALSAAGLVWVFLSLKNGKRGRDLALPLSCTGAVLWLTAASLLCSSYTFATEIGMALLCALPAVVGALAVIFFLYQREFFWCSVACAAGIVAIWVYRTIFTNHPNMVRLGFALVWAALALMSACAVLLRKNGGMLQKLRVLPAVTNYLIFWLSCAVTAAAMVITMLVGVASAYYVMFALIGWLFCLAVYCTVKLM